MSMNEKELTKTFIKISNWKKNFLFIMFMIDLK